MSNTPTIEFWYEFASTYSYPSAMRVEDMAQAKGVAVAYRPFLLGPLFYAQQGLTDSVFNAFPVKGRYMWRDLERICRREGVTLNRPTAFPRVSLTAARIAFFGENQPWIGAFTRAVYEANFVRDQDIADAEVLHGVLTSLNLDAATIEAAIAEPALKDAFKNRTEEAMNLGIFGAPTFIVRGEGAPELFWGFDRLPDALDWAVEPAIAPSVAQA